ncbi:MAG: FAD-dependent oxidoreductase [Nitrospira sp.]|nr:FAD-dependent oxidoreductase [Nitrospira sp.]
MPHQSYYDTVILGAGLGGLVAGTILARSGNKVIILEEKSCPGGATSLTHREGYPFVGSPVLLLGLEKDGYCDQLFSELGLSLTVLKRPGSLLRRSAPFLQIVTDQYRLDLQINLQEQLAEYKREWGDATAAFQEFYQEMDELDHKVYPFFFKKKVPGPPMPLRQKMSELQQALRRWLMIRAYSNLEGRNYLSRHKLPTDFLKILEWLNLLWTGECIEHTSALDLLLKQALLSREVIRPVGGLIKVCEALAKICLEYRGEIRYQQGIASIKRQPRKEWVVTLINGEDIHARQLIVHYPWNFFKPSTYEMVTFFFTIDSEVVPAPMSEQLLLCRPQDRSSASENPLFIVLSLVEEERTYIEKKRLLMVSSFYPRLSPLSEQDIRQLMHEVIKNLHWLMPFSEGKIQCLGNDYQDRLRGSKRLEKVLPLFKRLRQIKYPHIEYAYLPFDKSFFVLPDYANSLVMSTTEVRSAAEIANQLLKHR